MKRNEINVTKGKILIQDMKYAQISDILTEWCKIYNIKWKEIDKRLGDKNDEYLIGDLEYKYAKSIIIDNLKHFLLCFDKQIKSSLNNPVSTLNAKKLNKKEIIRLINSKNN